MREVSYESREYYPARVVEVDGRDVSGRLIMQTNLVYRPIKSMTMVSPDGEQIKMEFAEPLDGGSITLYGSSEGNG